MREIKFKFWDTEKSIMRYETLLGILQFGPTVNLLDFPVMQYTGLKDKNGKDIYHHDVIQWGPYKLTVIFNKENGHFTAETKDGTLYVGSEAFNQCELIGNIYENGELLDG